MRQVHAIVTDEDHEYRVGAKYAVLLVTNGRESVVGWGTDAASALKIVQTLNEAEGL